ncbi:hypothetical protein LSAT2_017308 [Lamellibrachia satsuma]|nr:hypothetical protein LSAT2_017308 [Lamellibrachia satsuma]
MEFAFKSCRRDTCQGRLSGIYPSACDSCGQYVTCDGSSDTPVRWGACGKWGWCLGGCGGCSSDTCVWKPDGDYQSLDHPRPFYYSCHNGHLSYKTCHPNERFNPWTRSCECYEVFCEKGDGFQPSVCRGCNTYLYCYMGHPLYIQLCMGASPFFNQNTHQCCGQCNSCYGGCKKTQSAHGGVRLDKALMAASAWTRRPWRYPHRQGAHGGVHLDKALMTVSA